MTQNKRTKEPFSLGFPGERWNPQLRVLVVPCREGETLGSTHVVLVAKTEGGEYDVYARHFEDKFTKTDSALMAKALVQNIIDSYLRG